MKVMVVEENAAPYRDDTFKEFIKQAKCDFLILTVNKKVDNHKEWEYKSPLEYCRKYCDNVINTKVGPYRRGTFTNMIKYKPDILITSSFIEEMMARMLGVSRVVFRSDTMRKGRHGDESWNKWALTKLYKLADSIWTTGAAGREYFSYYLKDTRPIYEGTYTNDVEKQYELICKERVNRDHLRRILGIDKTDFTFLFIGKLIESRHVDVLLAAMERMESQNNVKVIIIGNGPDEHLVRDYCMRHKNVVHIPSVPLKDLEKYYAISDAYVHPGEEPYSLALYEAAVAGIPIISSAKVGATADCLKDTITGYLFAFCDVDGMVSCMQKVVQGKLDQKNIISLQQYILKERNLEWAASELMKASGIIR